MDEFTKKLKEDSLNYLKTNFNLEEIFEFCFNNKVDVLKQDDQMYHCFINYNNGDGSWSQEIDALSSLVIGIKRFKKHFKK